MKIIDSISLINFQSHASSEMRFGGPGTVTGIVGPSGNGKTAILRALRWVCHNTPSGTDMIRANAKECTVTVKMADRTMIFRRRSRGGVNRYAITDATGKAEGYEAFGTGVPAEVQEAIGIKPLVIGDISMQLNFAGQLDGPFLGNEMPASTRAKVLGKLSGMEEVDFAGRLLGTDLYRRRRDLDASTAEAEALGQRLKDYDYLDSLGQAIDALKVMIDQAEDMQFNRDRFCRLRREADMRQDKLRDAAGRMKALDWLIKLPDLDLVADRLQRGRRLRETEDKCLAETDRLHISLEKVKGLSWLKGLPDMGQLDGDIQHFKKLYSLWDDRNGIDLVAEWAEGVMARTSFLRKVDAEKLDRNHIRIRSLKNLLAARTGAIANEQYIDALIQKALSAQPSLRSLPIEKIEKLRGLAARQSDALDTERQRLVWIRGLQEQEEKTLAAIDDLIRTTGRCPICHGELKKEDLI